MVIGIFMWNNVSEVSVTGKWMSARRLRLALFALWGWRWQECVREGSEVGGWWWKWCGKGKEWTLWMKILWRKTWYCLRWIVILQPIQVLYKIGGASAIKASFIAFGLHYLWVLNFEMRRGRNFEFWFLNFELCAVGAILNFELLPSAILN